MSTQATAESGLRLIPLASINPNVNNPRKHFDSASLKELAKSIESHGVLQPLVVRIDPMDGKKFEIITGERRFRASKIAGKKEIPAIVSELSDREALEIMVIENLQRQDVHPLEEARGYQALMTYGAEYGATGADKDKATAESIAAKVGKSVGYIYARLKLLSLIPAAQEGLDQQVLSPGHAVLIARLQPVDQVKALFAVFSVYHDPKKVTPDMKLAAFFGGNEDFVADFRVMPEKGLREWIQDNVNLKLKDVPWDLNDATLLPEAGACSDCPKRSESNPALFSELTIKGEDTCFDPVCFKAKRDAFAQIEIDRDQDKQRANEGVAEKHTSLRQISEQAGYTAPKPDQKVLKAGQWLPAKAGSCSSVEKALVVRGETAGERKLVCCNGACKVHKHSFQSASSHGSAVDDDLERFQEHKKRIRNRKKAAARAQLAREMVQKAGAKMPEAILREIVVKIADRREAVDILWLMGMDPKAAKAANFEKILNKAKGAQLNQLLIAALMANASAEYYDDNKYRPMMIEAAKHLGLKNPHGILSHHDDRINKVQTCRACGCTEESACTWYDSKTGKHIHCSWKEPDLCSFPECTKYDPKKVKQTSAKPEKKAKKQ